jgi:hypothetical protein
VAGGFFLGHDRPRNKKDRPLPAIRYQGSAANDQQSTISNQPSEPNNQQPTTCNLQPITRFQPSRRCDVPQWKCWAALVFEKDLSLRVARFLRLEGLLWPGALKTDILSPPPDRYSLPSGFA